MFAVARTGDFRAFSPEYRRLLAELAPRARKREQRILAPIRLPEGDGHKPDQCADPDKHAYADCRMESKKQYRDRVMRPHKAIHCSNPLKHESNGTGCPLESIGSYRARVIADVFADRYGCAEANFPSYRSGQRRPPQGCSEFEDDLRTFGNLRFDKVGRPIPDTIGTGPTLSKFLQDTPPPRDPRSKR